MDGQKPPPVGFELQNMEAGHGDPQPSGQPLYPSLGGPGGIGGTGNNGPTPVETVPGGPDPDDPRAASASAVNPAGLQDSEIELDTNSVEEGASLLSPKTGCDPAQDVEIPEVITDENLSLPRKASDIEQPIIEDETSDPKTQAEPEKRERQRETMYFKNGKSRIDYILAFKDSQEEHHQNERKTFEKNLLAEGLELEYTDKRLSQDGRTTFVKIHAPWEVLTRMAELLNIKMPIKEIDADFLDSVRHPRKVRVERLNLDNPEAPQLSDLHGFDEMEEYDIGDTRTSCFDQFPNPLEISDDILKPDPDYFTADFSRERADMFIIKDKETFFTNAQRSLCVNQLLLRTRYTEDGQSTKIGIDKLLRHGSYTAAFPLHEGKYSTNQSILLGADNDRQLLYETWAKPSRWYYFQPLDLIRKYFGEKIGIYFAWLGFYTSMLIPASLVGLIVFIYGCATVFKNEPSEDICNPAGSGNFTMCPLCDKRCSYWRLQSSCTYSRLTYLFDNGGTVFFAGFMAIWATMFLEFWKRKQAEIQYDWDVAGFEFEERMRPEFEARCNKYQKLNPITQMMEPFLPLYYKLPRRCTSVGVVLFMIICVLAAVFGVIMYRIIIVAVLYASDDTLIKQNAKITTTATAALISLVVIMLLNKVYERLAFWLTEFEHPRTDTEYDNSYTFKMFLFQFINYYASIFYIAFFKGRLGGRPGNYDYRLAYRAEECDPAGCLIELCIQLGIVMVGKQAFNNFKEVMLPKILNWVRARRARSETKENLYTRWEQDNDLSEQSLMGLFEEYLEMVIQYGFVTIFVAAFPLAPLFALINNVIEIRLDAYKFVTQWKRPVGVRAQDIGIWFGILQGISFLAVLSNAFIIGWTSDYVPKLMYKIALSEDDSLKGYVNYSLSFFNVSDFQPQSVPDEALVEMFGNVTLCRYADFRYPPWHENKYEFTSDYWHTFCARLAFVIVFEHLVFFLTWLVMYLIPDVPGEVKQLMLREVHLAKEARYSAAFSNIKEDKRKRIESEIKTA